MKIRFILLLGTVALIMILISSIFLLMMSLPTVLTFIPEHIEHGSRTEMLNFFNGQINAIFDAVLRYLAYMVIALIFQAFLLLSVIMKLRRAKKAFEEEQREHADSSVSDTTSSCVPFPSDHDRELS